MDALIDATRREKLSFTQLASRVDARADELAHLRGALVFLGATTTIATVVDMRALILVGATVALLDPNASPAVIEGWELAYTPDARWGFAHVAPYMYERDATAPATEAVLLATSGSTGNPKFVRLSPANIENNARQIAQALWITPAQRALAHLPLFYSYGLSVLNSHLAAGSTVVLTTASATQAEFWDVMREQRITTLPGVPYSYELYRRVGVADMHLPDLEHMTQAGGRLAPELVREFASAIPNLWVMYGQTEATARIAVLPAVDLPGAAGSVGRAIPGGSLTIADGEVVYRGPNVMLGYATSRADLGGGDDLGGVLRTGDLGRIDEDGRLWIEGRTRRIAKVFGTRVNLDDVEAKLSSFGRVAAVASGDRIAVFIEGDGDARAMERALGFPVRSLIAHAIDAVPTTASGKIDYQQLQAACAL